MTPETTNKPATPKTTESPSPGARASCPRRGQDALAPNSPESSGVRPSAPHLRTRLPNTVTVDKMRAGCRASRNELIKEVLRDYRYVEATGLGVPRKIVAGMRQHNGTEPDLVEEESRFIVRLWKRPQDTE